MTTTTTKTARTTAKKPAKNTTTKPAPARAIGDAAVGLERDIAAALRTELKHLKKTFETIQKDVHTAIGRVETALESVADAKPSANGSSKKATAKKVTPKRR